MYLVSVSRGFFGIRCFFHLHFVVRRRRGAPTLPVSKAVSLIYSNCSNAAQIRSQRYSYSWPEAAATVATLGRGLVGKESAT